MLDLQKKLYGIMVPVVTPLTEERQIDRESTERLLEYLITSGIHSIFILGSAGEGPLISGEMEESFVHLVVENVDRRVPILMGISDTSMRRVLEKAMKASANGIDAVVSALPCYFSPGRDGQLRYYELLAKKSPIPVMMYDIPSRVKVKLQRDVVLEMARHDNMIGLKDTSGNLSYFRHTIEELGERDMFRVFIGDTMLIDIAILLGADGAVSTDGNLVPELCLEIYEKISTGDIEGGMMAQRYLNQLRRNRERIHPNISGLPSEAIKQELAEKQIIKCPAMMEPY